MQCEGGALTRICGGSAEHPAGSRPQAPDPVLGGSSARSGHPLAGDDPSAVGDPPGAAPRGDPDVSPRAVATPYELATHHDQAANPGQRSVDLAEQLRSLTVTLSAALTREQVAAAVLSAVRTAVGGGGVGVVLRHPQPAGPGLILLDTLGYPADLIEAWRDRTLDEATPAGEALRSRLPVYLSTEDEARRRFPGLFAVPPAVGGPATRAWAAVPMSAGGTCLGVLIVSAGRAFPAADRLFLETVAGQCALALERTRLDESTTTERERLYAVLARLPVGVIIWDVPAHRLVHGNAEIERIWRLPLTSAGAAGDRLPQRGFHPADNRPYQPREWPLARTIEHGEVVTGEEIDIERGDGSRGTIVVNSAPIRAASGTVVAGVATFQDVSDRVEAQRRVEELYEAELRARTIAEAAWRRVERLQRITVALAEAVSPPQVADVIVRNGRSLLAAVGAWVGLLDDAGADIVMLGSSVPASDDDLPDRIPVAAAGPISDAVRLGRPVWLESAAAVAVAYPAVAGGRTVDEGAICAVPLLSAGRPVGAIALRFAGEHAFDPEDRALAVTLAEQCAQALERARLHAWERGVARTLQHSMLPAALPEIASADLAARYRPAEESLEVGGDWYDVVALPGGQVALAVGDVVGRGLGAATAMGQLRSALSALAGALHGPAQALDALERFAEHVEGARCATVTYAVLDLVSGRLRYACAGHPPPLMLRPDGTAEFLEAGRSPMLCVGAGPRAGREAEVVLPAGTTLLFYTDGLVERRGESLDDGLARLVKRASDRWTGSAEALCAGLLDAMLADTSAADDVAMLCLRYSPPLIRRVPARRENLPGLRRDVQAWLVDAGADGAEIGDIVLACGEACANVAAHAYPDTTGEVSVELSYGPRRLVEIKVRDAGRWGTGPGSDDRGRGLRLMRALMDSVEVTLDATGTVVTLRRELGGPTAPDPPGGGKRGGGRRI